MKKIGEDYRIKQMLSPIIKATAYSGETQENKELNITSIYSGEKWKCWPHTIVWEYLTLINLIKKLNWVIIALKYNS